MALISLQTLAFSSPRSSLCPSPSRSTVNLSSPFAQSIARKAPVRRISRTRSLTERAMASSVSGFDSGVVDALGDVGILSAATDEPVFFRDLWDQNEGVAVVALLRHFGCFCCWELASVLKEAKPTFDSSGVKLIAVGVGTLDKAHILAEQLPFPLDCLYADPNHKAYDVLGLYYGLGRTFFNPASVKVFSRFESIKKALKNYTIAATPDDKSSVLQQGGMFVFKGKQLLYARKDEGTGDHAPLEDILNICCKTPVP
ncbi:Thioredoxin-like protein [Dioscorea alata]|uniref:Thioredoxin-like protein n=1 Tax=Dioscorea alata TaxID=55571 RepID=A0ACB7WNC0_DIOAL|nr:Thioredoxin-like protein [Dioscorea alata]